MANTEQVSEVEAIRQVIAEGNAMDFVDVAEAVQKRFRLDVTASKVEQVVYDMVNSQKPAGKDEQPPPVRIAPRVGVEMMSAVVDDASQKAAAEPAPEPTASTEPADEMAHALHFVKSVNGLANAKRALAELESVLLGQ